MFAIENLLEIARIIEEHLILHGTTVYKYHWSVFTRLEPVWLFPENKTAKPGNSEKCSRKVSRGQFSTDGFYLDHGSIYIFLEINRNNNYMMQWSDQFTMSIKSRLTFIIHSNCYFFFEKSSSTFWNCNLIFTLIVIKKNKCKGQCNGSVNAFYSSHTIYTFKLIE